MPIYSLQSADDPRIACYRDLPNHSPSEQFVVEGRWLTERLVASSHTVHSILAKASVAAELANSVSAETPIFSARARLLSEIVGFSFHRGVLAAGVRPAANDLIRALPPAPEKASLAVCAGVQNRENLGGILRNAAGLGCNGLLADGESADPFARRSLRVSMGAPLFLPTETTNDLALRLKDLRDQEEMAIVGTTLSAAAQPLHTAPQPSRVAVLFGSESHGLPSEIESICDTLVTIPMAARSDSLNVAAASAIALHYFRFRIE